MMSFRCLSFLPILGKCMMLSVLKELTTASFTVWSEETKLADSGNIILTFFGVLMLETLKHVMPAQGGPNIITNLLFLALVVSCYADASQ